MVCVCPPHTSMMTHGRVAARPIARASVSAAAASRYSSMNFIPAAPSVLGRRGSRRAWSRWLGGSLALPNEFVELSEFFQEGEHPVGLGFVQSGEGEADMHQHVVAGCRFRDVFETRGLANPAEIDLPHEKAVFAVDL